MSYCKTVKKYNSDEYADVTFDAPDTCPCCGNPTVPYFVSAICETESHMTAMYVCQSCRTSFLTRYNLFGSEDTKHAEIVESVPITPIKVDFKKEIWDISPRFCNVYNQAAAAEGHNLYEICGLGYRKALEILVKDFSILTHPEDKEAIVNEFHMEKLIKKYLPTYTPVQDISAAGFRSGNNEAHYRNDAGEENIKELKAYIATVVNCIEIEANAGKARQCLANRKHQNH